MPAEVKKEIQLEIAHVLFIDIDGELNPVASLLGSGGPSQ
jgi:hypothetical protein